MVRGLGRRVLCADPQANEAIGQYLRARRAVYDVNPETGEEDPSALAALENTEAGKAPAGGKGNG